MSKRRIANIIAVLVVLGTIGYFYGWWNVRMHAYYACMRAREHKPVEVAKQQLLDGAAAHGGKVTEESGRISVVFTWLWRDFQCSFTYKDSRVLEVSG